MYNDVNKSTEPAHRGVQHLHLHPLVTPRVEPQRLPHLPPPRRPPLPRIPRRILQKLPSPIAPHRHRPTKQVAQPQAEEVQRGSLLRGVRQRQAPRAGRHAVPQAHLRGRVAERLQTRQRFRTVRQLVRLQWHLHQRQAGRARQVPVAQRLILRGRVAVGMQTRVWDVERGQGRQLRGGVEVRQG